MNRLPSLPSPEADFGPLARPAPPESLDAFIARCEAYRNARPADPLLPAEPRPDAVAVADLTADLRFARVGVTAVFPGPLLGLDPAEGAACEAVAAAADRAIAGLAYAAKSRVADHLARHFAAIADCPRFRD